MNLYDAKYIIENANNIRHKSEIYILDESDPGYMYVAYDQNKNKYEIPGGGSKKSENPLETAIRETLEEVAVKCKNIRLLKDPAIINLKNINYKKNKYDYLVVNSYVGYFDKIDKKLYGDGPEGKLKLKKVKIDEMILYFKNLHSKINMYTKNTILCLNLIKNI